MSVKTEIVFSKGELVQAFFLGVIFCCFVLGAVWGW